MVYRELLAREAIGPGKEEVVLGCPSICPKGVLRVVLCRW